MGEGHGAAAQAQGTREKTAGAEIVESDASSDDIHDGVHRAHFMKVNMLHRFSVDGRLRPGQPPKYRQRHFLDRILQPTPFDQPVDLPWRASMGVPSILDLDTEVDPRESVPVDLAGGEAIGLERQRSEPPPKVIQGEPQIQQPSQDHVPAHAVEGVEVEYAIPAAVRSHPAHNSTAGEENRKGGKEERGKREEGVFG